MLQPTQGPGAPLFVRAVSARFGEGMRGLLQELRLLLQGRHEILGRWLNMEGQDGLVSHV